MKRTVALFLTLALMIGLASTAFAVPDTVKFDSTKSFLQKLDDESLNYTLVGVEDSGEEHVRLGSTIVDDNHNVTFQFFFNEDGRRVTIIVWNLIDFDAANLEQMYKICNELNAGWKYASFYVDESDNSITVSCDMVFTPETAGDVLYEVMMRLYNVMKSALTDTLLSYAK